MAKILTIEDDALTAREIVTELANNGNEVESVGNGREGLERALTGAYDAITLDRMLPEVDGLTLVTELRRAGIDTPVLMISALSDVDARVRGLRAGGDDYLTKPFAPDEMAARVEVLLRRQDDAAQTTIAIDGLVLDRMAHAARYAGRDLDLKPTE
ncbi:response regulator transcription factor, partial [Rudaea sp.]|uniref:response regulator transcription factor n=1 Tax=Rudaea sp. TaxID=2136325 RepID=UPI002ED1BFF0